jgi:ABC-type polysaccharide/polyol phosphate export permease
MKSEPQCRIFLQLLKTDLALYFKQMFVGDIIDSACWTVMTVAIVTYIYPELGMTDAYGAFCAIGAIANISFFEIYGNAVTFVSDIAADRVIIYPLILPIKSVVWYFKMITYYAVRASCLSLTVFPLTKLLLGQRLSLSNFSLLHFVCIFISFNIFVAVASLLVASIIKSMAYISQMWLRFLAPLWYFGGSQYSWHTLYKVAPKFAYLSLLNPLFYGYEGMHAAMLGQTSYLPFWTSLIALWLFIILFGVWGFIRLKKWLDFV